MQGWRKLVAGSALALGIVALAPVAQAAPAGAGTLGVERSAPASVVDQVHYRRHRHCYRHRGHWHCPSARYHRYHRYHHPHRAAGIYLSIGPFGHWGHRRHHWHRHHHHRHHGFYHHRHRHWW